MHSIIEQRDFSKASLRQFISDVLRWLARREPVQLSSQKVKQRLFQWSRVAVRREGRLAGHFVPSILML